MRIILETNFKKKHENSKWLLLDQGPAIGWWAVSVCWPTGGTSVCQSLYDAWRRYCRNYHSQLSFI